MPTPEMWPTIQNGNFWLIDGQHNVEAAKKIQNMTNWQDPNNQKEKLKWWKALVVWSDEPMRLNDISRFFNMGNKKKAYQAFWIRNIMASINVWEFYGMPPRERENAKEKNSNWEVSMVSADRPKLLPCCIYCYIVWYFDCLYDLGQPAQTLAMLHILLYCQVF